MSTKLKPISKFISTASYQLSRGATVEEIRELSKEFDITEERVEQYLKDRIKASNISSAMVASKDEKEIIYNTLDQKFIEAYPNIVIYRRGNNILFYEYVKGVYKMIFEQEMENNIDTFMAENYLLEHRTVRRKIKDTIGRIISLLSRTEGRNFTDDIVAREKWLLNLQNGLLDMETFILKPHTPKYFSIVQVPYDFNPTATCPKFERFIETISDKTKSTAQMIQEMFGYSIMEGNPKHKVFYLYGDTARNGKSTTAKIICGLIGWGNVSTLTLQELGSENPFKMTSLVGKQLNFSDEISSKYVESSKLTMLSAEASVEIDTKFKDPYQYKITTKFIITCNDLPRFQDSQGMKHRMITIPFNYQIPEADRIERYDDELLKAEGSGILNWAIEGSKFLKKNGVFTINEQSREEAHENTLHSNSVYAFMENEYKFDSSFIGAHYNDFLFGNEHSPSSPGTEYRLYCGRNGIKPLAKMGFDKELKRYERETKKIEQRKDSEGYRYYIGLLRKKENRGEITNFNIIGDKLQKNG